MAFPGERTERAATVNPNNSTPFDSIDARLAAIDARLAAFDQRIAADLTRLATIGTAR